MRIRNGFQRRRAELAHQRRAAVPDVVRDPRDAAQQMRFFDQLGPAARAAIRGSRFDFDAVGTWQDAYRMELGDWALAARVANEDNRRSGTFGPKAPNGI